jgi:membrane-associated phospholipid phosphatase
MRVIFFLLISILASGLKGQTDFPYKFSTQTQITTLLGASAQIGALLLPDPALSSQALSQLDRNNINFIDRSATYQWSLEAARKSDETLTFIGILPGTIGLNYALKKQWNNALVYGLMYTETVLITNGVKDLTKDVVKRTRPLFYNDNLSFSDRWLLANEGDARTSFYSGHTALAFASAAFLSSTHQRLFDAPKRSNLLWAGTLTLASSTGYLRFKAGKHFPTDIISGAIIGTSMGILIPRIHLEKKNWTLIPSPKGVCFSLAL